MFCGVLYIRDYFKGSETVAVCESNFEKVSQKKELLSGKKNFSEICVVLDAGHGGIDGGTTSETVIEKEVNLSVTMYLKQILEEHGMKVVLTRNSDVNVELSQRIEIARQADADLFVSLHCNYYEDATSIAGLECYYIKGADESKEYAESIIAAVKQSETIAVREARNENYFVLRETTMPAVLIEMGFLSNDKECENLADENYQKELAEKIAEGILQKIINDKEK